jgi:uncharacterized damage-inducible protein DinB
MLTNDILLDAFERVKEVVHNTVQGLSLEQLTYRPTADANSIAWLIWHLSRIQDDHIAAVAGHQQVWTAQEWIVKFNLPFTAVATGWGQTSEDVAKVRADAKLLVAYYDAVHTVTVAYLKSLKTADYKRIVDKNWDPPVTLAVRLVSVIDDDLQHAGQAAYLRGILPKS